MKIKTLSAIAFIIVSCLLLAFGVYTLVNKTYDPCNKPQLKFDYEIGESNQLYFNDDPTYKFHIINAAKTVIANQTCFAPKLVAQMEKELA